MTDKHHNHMTLTLIVGLALALSSCQKRADVISATECSLSFSPEVQEMLSSDDFAEGEVSTPAATRSGAAPQPTPFVPENIVTVKNMGSAFVFARRAGTSTDEFRTNIVSNDNGATWTYNPVRDWPDYALTFTYYWRPGMSQHDKNVFYGNTDLPYEPGMTLYSHEDVIMGSTTGSRQTLGSDGKTHLRFKHIYAQIEIQAKCENPHIKVEVKAVKLCNIYLRATMTRPDVLNDPTGEKPYDSTFGWKGYQEQGNVNKVGYVAHARHNTQYHVVLTKTPQRIPNLPRNFLVIPQKHAKWAGDTSTTGAYIGVLCRISNLYNGQETLLVPRPKTNGDKQEGKYAYVAVPMPVDWRGGYKYVYTLDFCNPGNVPGKTATGGGQVPPDWSDPVNYPNVVHPHNLNGNDPLPIGSPVLTGPIGLSIGVAPWDKSEEPRDIDVDVVGL